MKNLLNKFPFLTVLYSGICIVTLSVLVFSCSSGKSTVTSAEQKAMIEDLVASKNFKIESDAAYPRNTFAMTQVLNTGILGPGNTANRISLIGNPNVLEISGDSVSSHLPYFGERQAGGPYNRRSVGISLKGPMEDYKAEWDESKNRYVISFTAMDENESFDVHMLLYPNRSTSMVLTGSRRFSIEYRGRVFNAE